MANPKPTNPLKPLSVGDVVSSGVKLYRSRFSMYLKLSLVAYLWVLLPIYGWAKFAEITGRMSRLAFADFVGQPESPEAATRKTSPKKWRFLIAGILTVLIYFAFFIGGAIILGIGTFLLSSIAPPLGIAFSVIGSIVFIVAYVRLVTRLFLVEVPIAVENNVGARGAISRSRNLTAGAAGRVQWVVVITFLISLLAQIPVQIVSAVLPTAGDVGLGVALLLTLIVIILSIVCNASVQPLWQVMKAVVYHDLRSRREGYGLQLRR